MTIVELRRQQILLGEAASAITQCTAILGETATNQILAQIGGKQQEIIDQIDAELHP